MKIKKSAYLEFHECNNLEINALMEHYTIDNPAYDAYTDKQPKRLNLAFHKDSVVYAPRNKIPAYAKDYEDNTVIGDFIDYKFNGSLHDFQQDITKTVLDNIENNVCDQTIKSPCGSGKTVMALSMIASLKRKAAIVVPSSDLASQWVERVKKFLPENSVSIVDGSNKKVSDVTIITVQTLYKLNPIIDKLTPAKQKLYDELQSVGIVVFDEFHRLGAEKWVNSIGVFSSRIRLAFSATPKRSDDMETVIFCHAGNLTVSINFQDLAKKGILMSPEVTIVRSKEKILVKNRWNGEFNYAATCTKATESEGRNTLLLNMVKEAEEMGRTCLILSNRVEHFIYLYKKLEAMGIEAGVIAGKLTAKEFFPDITREEALSKSVIIANMSLTQEGLDLPQLDTVFLVVPVSSESILEQILGRLTRLYDKSPLLLDIWDSDYSISSLVNDSTSLKLSPLDRMALSRYRTYNRLQCKIRNFK